MFVFPDQSFGRPSLAVVQAVILRQFNLRLKSELRFAVRVVHMHVKPGFLAQEEKEPESVLSCSIVFTPMLERCIGRCNDLPVLHPICRQIPKDRRK